MTQSVIISVEGTQRFIGEESQTVQVVTEGTMKREGDTVYLSYEESEVTGMEGTTTTFTVKGERVELERTGAVQSKMVFEKGKKDISLYNVGFGALTFIGDIGWRRKGEFFSGDPVELQKQNGQIMLADFLIGSLFFL